MTTRELVYDNLKMLREYIKDTQKGISPANPLYINVEETNPKYRVYLKDHGFVKNLETGDRIVRQHIKPLKNVLFQVSENKQTGKDEIKAQSVGQDPNIIFFKKSEIVVHTDNQQMVCDITFALRFLIQQGVLSPSEIQEVLRDILAIAIHAVQKSQSKADQSFVYVIGNTDDELASLLLLDKEFQDPDVTKIFQKQVSERIGSPQLKKEIPPFSKIALEQLREITSKYRSSKFRQLEELVTANMFNQDDKFTEVLEFIRENFNLDAEQLDELVKLRESTKNDRKGTICRMLDTILYFNLNNMEQADYMGDDIKKEIVQPEVVKELVLSVGEQSHF